jgi:hypothetical protein
VFPRGLVVPGDRGVPAALTQTYYRAFAPRIGARLEPVGLFRLAKQIVGRPRQDQHPHGWGCLQSVEQLVLEQFSAEPPFGEFHSTTFFQYTIRRQDGTINQSL